MKSLNKGCFKKGHTPWNKGLGNGRAKYKDEAEKILGRQLLSNEVVHHIDGNRSNNSPENLKVYSSHSEHMKEEHSHNMSERGKLGAKIQWQNVPIFRINYVPSKNRWILRKRIITPSGTIRKQLASFKTKKAALKYFGNEAIINREVRN